MREAAEYQQKTIEFTKSIKTSLVDILGLALASSGLGPVVTSINGQSGDVQLDLGSSAVTSVNGQTGDVDLNIPITHVGRYEPEGAVDT